jgi:hypothetical protein
MLIYYLKKKKITFIEVKEFSLRSLNNEPFGGL